MQVRRSWSLALFGLLIGASAVLLWVGQPHDLRATVLLGLLAAAFLLFGTPSPANWTRTQAAGFVAALVVLALAVAVVAYRRTRPPVVSVRLAYEPFGLVPTMRAIRWQQLTDSGMSDPEATAKVDREVTGASATGTPATHDTTTLYVVPGNPFLDSLARTCTLHRRAVDSLQSERAYDDYRRRYLRDKPFQLDSLLLGIRWEMAVWQRVYRTLAPQLKAIATDSARPSPAGFVRPLRFPMGSKLVLLLWSGVIVDLSIGTVRGPLFIDASKAHNVRCDSTLNR